MRDLLDSDPRFKIEAYQFIRESLQYAHEHILDLDGFASLPTEQFTPSDDDEIDLDSLESELEEAQHKPNHVTGQQLCEACRLYAAEQYGYLANMVLGSWGINSTSDLGDLVYNLIRIEQMRKSDTDRREDFDDVYDFATAFDPQFELATEAEE